MYLRMILVLGGLLSVAQAATNTSWTSINDCLRKSGVPIDEKGSVDWIRDAAAYNVRLPTYTPAAIAVPTTIPQIQGAVKCGRDLKLKLHFRGIWGESGHLVIQLDRMRNVTLDPLTNTAIVEPGTRLGHMATELIKQGNRAIAHGTCPRVGASGHMTSGGYGMSSRTHGLALDFVEGTTVVLADGSVVEASLEQNPDLFWAIRGAGNNFGIVALWRLKTFEAPADLTWFRVTLGWNQSTAARHLAAVEDYIKTKMPAELNFRIADYEKGRPFAEGLFYGDEKQMNKGLAEFLIASNGTLFTSHQVDWLDAIKHYSSPPANTNNKPDNFFSKSLTLNSLSGSVGKAFVDYWYGTANRVDRRWFFQIDAAGGANSAYAQPGNAATAFAHRDKTFIIQFYDAVDSNLAYPANGTAFLNGWVAKVTAALGASGGTDGWGAYANYPDPTLGRDEAQMLYYGTNLERLQRLKLRYDPEERFYYPQSIVPWGKRSSRARRLPRWKGGRWS
ncbi:FAD-linked oxidoreductase azaL [Apiospora marii]|uniref:FAD-linked oxidoreductase azaL n=1 Tax=Apiospora marii TaxID=335849 RepID=A0ABR1STS8_9PEZI